MAPELLEIGRIDRAHGVRGEVIVRLVTNRDERVAPGSTLRTGDRTLRVVGSRRQRDRWIVSFAGVTDRDAAEALRGAVLYAEPLDDPDELWVHELIGADVVDATGVRRGKVVEVQANPASDLLVLDTGALVPVRFVTSVEAGRRVEVDTPSGLFDGT
ncbi:MAG TPA: ribosome maturation factor RimM [Acidimicrobiales bacterium]